MLAYCCGFLCFLSLLILLQTPLGNTQRKESLELCEFSAHTPLLPLNTLELLPEQRVLGHSKS